MNKYVVKNNLIVTNNYCDIQFNIIIKKARSYLLTTQRFSGSILQSGIS